MRNILKIIGLVVLSIIVTFLTAGAIMFVQNKFGLYIDIDGTILTFVGILATFIVVGNYAQVVKIERDLKEELRRTATEEAKKVFGAITESSISQDLYMKAMSTKDCDDRLLYLKEAKIYCKDESLKKKIEKFIEITKKEKESDPTSIL